MGVETSRNYPFTDTNDLPEMLKQEVLTFLARALAASDKAEICAFQFDPKTGIDFYKEVARFEVELIQQALIHTHGNQSGAARLLGLKVTTLNSKVKLYGLGEFIRGLLTTSPAPSSILEFKPTAQDSRFLIQTTGHASATPVG